MNKILLSIIIFSAILAVAIGGYLFLEPKTPQQPNDEIRPDINTEKPVEISAPEQTINWKTYHNEKYGFEMKYPGDWIMDGNMISEEPNTSGIQINTMDDLTESQFVERIKNCSQTVVGEADAYRCQPPVGAPYYEIHRDTTGFLITNFYYDNLISTQILSTFEFIK